MTVFRELDVASARQDSVTAAYWAGVSTFGAATGYLSIGQAMEADYQSISCPLDGVRCDEVKQFISRNPLAREAYNEALAHLIKYFGRDFKPKVSLATDPEDGSQLLRVEIPWVSSPSEVRGRLSAFNHEWWYDRIAQYGGLIAFRVARSSGI